MSNVNVVMNQAAAANVAPFWVWDLSYAYYDPPFGRDLSTAIYAGRLVSVGAQSSNPAAVFFKPDGTKMYVTGSTSDSVHEYDLSTPWASNTASYLQSFSVNAQETGPRGLFFKPDGTKMYVIGTTDDDVNEYDLSTAWDVTTASYLQNFSVNAQETGPQGLAFKPDGTKMYITGTTGDNVNEYDLSTAWDVTTASYLQNFSVSGQDISPQAISFIADGTKMYVLGSVGEDVNEYTLGTAWDISTASFVRVFSVSAQTATPQGLFVRPAGEGFYVSGRTSDRVYQYTMGQLDVSSKETNPNGISFKTDGTKMYIVGQSGDDVNEYSLSTPWDIATASYSKVFYIGSEESTPEGIFFKPDGTKMYIVGSGTDAVYEYDLSTAWDVSTASYSDNSLTVSGQDTGATDLFFKPDGTKMYVVGLAGDDVNEYNLSTAWNISTASYSKVFDSGVQETAPRGISFKPDGTRMYVIGSGEDGISEFTLDTPWDVSTASYVGLFFAGNEATSPEALFFKPDGTQFFIVTNFDAVASYTIAPQT